MAQPQLTEKDIKLTREAFAHLRSAYERQLNSKNNDLIKETYKAMLKELDATVAKFAA